MGVYITVLEALIDRLNNAKTGSLSDLKAVYIGTRSLVETQDLTPSITIDIAGIDDDDGEIKQYNRQDMLRITLLIKYPALADGNGDYSNIYYDTNTGEGIIYFIEKLEDVLFTNSLGSLDTTFANILFTMPKLSLDKIDRNGNLLIATLSIEARTNNFKINERSL